MKDKTLGLIGFGLIGKKVTKIARVFGTNVIAYDPYVDQNTAQEFNIKLETLDNIFSKSDVILCTFIK